MNTVHKILKLFKNKRLLLSIVLVGIFVSGSFVIGDSVNAQDGGGVFGWVSVGSSFLFELFLTVIIGILGFALEIVVLVLITVLQYSDFVTARPVILGWTLVRDLANLFFAVILLAIAFGTILRIENYNFKKLLPRLLIMAVLVNFSLLIAGLLIDAAQVVMLTFVAAFDETIGSNIFQTLHVNEILFSVKEFSNDSVIEFADVVMNGVLAIVFLAVALLVITIITLVLVGRMVALWLLLVLAPLPYIFNAFPYTKSYAQQWWKEFIKYLIYGPSVAFFLWLSFAVVNQGNFAIVPEGTDVKIVPSDRSIFIQIAEFGNFLTYIIGIAMLLGGLVVTQKAGVVGGNLAVSGLRIARKAPFVVGAWTARKVKAGALGKTLGGLDFNPMNIVRNIQGTLADKKKEDITQGNTLAGGRLKKGGFKGAVLGLGAKDWGNNYLKGFMGYKGIQTALYGKGGKTEEFKEDAEEQERIAQGLTSGQVSEMTKEMGSNEADAQHYQSMIDNQEAFYEDKNVKEALNKLVDSIDETVESLHKEAAKTRKDKDGDPDVAAKLESEADEKMKQSNAIRKEISQADLVNADGMFHIENLHDLSIKPDSDEFKRGDHLKTANLVEEAISSMVEEREAKANELKEKVDLGTDENRRVYTEQEKADAKEKAETLRVKEEKAATWTPRDPKTRGERRAGFEEKRKEFGETTNEYELMAAFKSALTRGELNEAGGIALQATKVGHLNELVNATAASQKYYFDRLGKIVTEFDPEGAKYGRNGLAFDKGETFSSDADGFNGFIKEAFVKQLKADEQTAYSLQNDLSNVAESVNHWTFGQAVTTDADGIYKQNSKEQQQMRTYIEMGKADYENLSRRGNRLAWMTEDWIDQKDHKKGREATLNNVGIDNIRNNYRAMNANFSRSRVNKNLVLNLVSNTNNLDILQEIGSSITDPAERKEWETFMRNVRSFAGKLTAEGGSLTSRAAHELSDAENIREKITGRRETFFK